MNEIMEIVQSSPPIALAIALNLLGLALKKSPIQNWIIPLALPVAGAIAYPFIAESGKINFECKNPDMLLAVYGFVIGSGSVGLNQMLRQFLDRKNGSGNTEFLKKPTNEETK